MSYNICKIGKFMKKPNRYKLNKFRKKLKVSKAEFAMLINVVEKVYTYSSEDGEKVVAEKQKKEDA